MKKLTSKEYDIRNGGAFSGYSQNCKVNVLNKSKGIVVEILKAEYPILIKEDLLLHIVDSNRGIYEKYSRNFRDANKNWILSKIKKLEDELKELKFHSLLCKRKNVEFIDKTKKE